MATIFLLLIPVAWRIPVDEHRFVPSPRANYVRPIILTEFVGCVESLLPLNRASKVLPTPLVLPLAKLAPLVNRGSTSLRAIHIVCLEIWRPTFTALEDPPPALAALLPIDPATRMLLTVTGLRENVDRTANGLCIGTEMEVLFLPLPFPNVNIRLKEWILTYRL